MSKKKTQYSYRDPCPTPEKHTQPDEPKDYSLWHEWALEMCKTHYQRRCPGCRLLKIWVPKIKRPDKIKGAIIAWVLGRRVDGDYAGIDSGGDMVLDGTFEIDTLVEQIEKVLKA